MNTAEHLCSAVGSALGAVSLVERLDPSFSGCLPLLAGVERMAFRADIDSQFLFDRTCHECVPAGTRYFDFLILGMDFFPHYCLHLTFHGRFDSVMR